MIVIIALYLSCNVFLAGLKTLFTFARATYNFEKIRCKNKKASVAEDSKIDLEFSSKSKSILLRKRIGKGLACKIFIEIF